MGSEDRMTTGADEFKIDYMPTLIIVNENGYKKYEGQRKITKYLES